MRFKITTVGNSAGVILPKDLLLNMRLKKGDVLLAAEVPDGIRLIRYDAELDRQMSAAEKVLHEHGDLLRRLPD